MRKTLRSGPVETARRPVPEAASGSARTEAPATVVGLEVELAELERLSLDDLRLRWRNHGAGSRRPISPEALSYVSWPIAFRQRRSAICTGKPFACWTDWRMMRRIDWPPTDHRRPIRTTA